MLEIKLEDACCEIIINLGGKAVKMNVAGTRGWPDRMILLPNGIIFFIEFKRPRKGVVSRQQDQIRKDLTALGFAVYLVDNIETFHNILGEEGYL